MSWGLDPDSFWEQVPGTYHSIIKGREDLNQQTLELSIISSWYNERFAREKKLKSPSEYIKELKSKGQQTREEILAIFMSFENAGIPVSIKKLN